MGTRIKDPETYNHPALIISEILEDGDVRIAMVSRAPSPSFYQGSDSGGRSHRSAKQTW